MRWAVYDRNGAQCFVSHDGDTIWDGEFNGKRVVEGVYVVIIEYFNPNNGKQEIFKGDLTVIR